MPLLSGLALVVAILIRWRGRQASMADRMCRPN